MPKEEEPKKFAIKMDEKRAKLWKAELHRFLANDKQSTGEVSYRMKHLDLSLSTNKDDFSASI